MKGSLYCLTNASWDCRLSPLIPMTSAPAFLELFVCFAESASLCSAASSEVLGIEINNQVALAEKVFQSYELTIEAR